MALIFKTFYTVEFDTTSGSDINWELDILRSYDDADAVPSWFSDPVVSLTCAQSPIEIDYQRDWDVYKPIQGSEAVVRLMVETAGQYIDLNSGNPFEWQVRLRYRDSANTLQPFWCGYISPVDGDESVTTFPFEVSYTALDGLGLLENRVVPPIEDTVSGIFQGRNDINLFNVVQYAVRQTGLGLDVYVDSKINNSTGDALLNTMIDPYSFYTDSDKTELKTLKEALEGILSTFNCKITQAKGRWYIYNASTISDSTTWKVFNTEGIAQADVVESLRTNITGASGDIIPTNSDLKLHTRRPYGSIECRPKDLVAANIVENGGFELEEEGWQKNPSSFDDIDFSETIRLEGIRSIVSNRNRRTLTNASDVWFESSTGYEVDEKSAIDINIDWLGEILIDSGSNGVRNVRLAYQVYFVPTSPLASNFLQVPSLGVPSYQSIANATLFWDFVNTEWKPYGDVFQPGSKSETLFREPNVTDLTKEVIAGSADVGEWLNEQITIDAPREYYDAQDSAYYEVPEGRLFLRFFYPRGNRPQGSGKAQFRQHGTGSLRAYVDNITISHQFENDIEAPVFERVQENYTSTYTYEPSFSSDANSLIIQSIDVKDYSRAGQTETKSLEEIGTQLKLNDFHTQFKYYEGTLTNNTSTPLTPINKIGVNFSNYTETSAGVFNGGKFNPKANTTKAAFYIPNQALDIAPMNRMDLDIGDYDGTTGELRPGYYTENIDLVSVPFAGRSEKVSYVLAFDIEARDASNDVIADGLVPSETYVNLVGIPGDTISYKLQLVPAAGYIGNANSFALTNTDDDPRPEYAVYQSGISYVQGNLELPLTITFPEVSEFETLKATIGVLESTPESTPGTVTSAVVIANSGTNLAAPSSKTYDVSGVPGSTVHFTHHIGPVNDNWQVFGGNFDATYSDSSLTNQDAVGGPDGVSIDFAYHIPTTGESISVTVTGNATAAGVIGVDIFTRTVNFGTAPANTRFHEDSNTFTGVPQSTHDYFITLIPDADYQITSVATPSLPSGIVANGAPYPAGENWEIPVQVTIGASSDSLNITQGAITVSEEPYSVSMSTTTSGVNFIVEPAELVWTFDDGDLGQDINGTVYVRPVNGYMFTAPTTDVTVDIVELAAGVYSDGSNVYDDTVPARNWTAAIQSNLDPDGRIQIQIAGKLPLEPGSYSLPLLVTGNSATGGGATVEMPATTATLTTLSQGLSCLGGGAVFELETDGNWIAEVDSDVIGFSSQSNGTFNENISSIISGFVVRGSFAPYRGGAGSYGFTLEVGPQPFVIQPSPPSYSPVHVANGNIQYTISIFSADANFNKIGSAIRTATINQHQDYGPGEVTAPAAITDDNLSSISSANGFDQWIFNRPMS